LNKARYTISADIWNKLAPIDQAAIVIHELIYREMALPPSAHMNSEPTIKVIRFYCQSVVKETNGKHCLSNFTAMAELV
jgi:hypothetical protein